jgi:hypothetical protein
MSAFWQTKSLDPTWVPEWSGLAAAYRFNGTGNLANGTQIQSLTGSSVATVTSAIGGLNYATGKVLQGLSFNGQANYLSIPRMIQDDFTINFWFKSNQNTGSSFIGCNWWSNPGIVSADYSGPANDFGSSLCGGSIFFGTGNPDLSIYSTTNVADDNWHMVTETRVRATGTFQLYIDGVLEASSSAGGTQSLTAPATIQVGRVPSYGGAAFTGSIDELAFWTVALKQSEITLIYNKQH